MIDKISKIDGIKILSKNKQLSINGGSVNCEYTHNFCDHSWEGWSDYADCMITYDCYHLLPMEFLIMLKL